MHKVTKSFSDRYTGSFKIVKRTSPMSHLIQRGRIQNDSILKLYKQRGTRRIRERGLSRQDSAEFDAAQKEDTSNSSDEEVI